VNEIAWISLFIQLSPFGRHDKALIIKALFGFLAALEIIPVKNFERSEKSG